jgi:glycosyltransferase involved in cell wall biosynthesis
MAQPEIAILVSTFERPRHLRRVLASIAAQRGVRQALEVVVTDDGSRDRTPRLVQEFAASVQFPVHFTTHPHEAFHIARCRNEGVSVTTAPYLLFLDGDCMIPPDHVQKHLDRRRDGSAMAGYPIYLDEQISDQITEEQIAEASYVRHVTAGQRLGMRWRHVRGTLAWLARDRQRPKLLGGNLGIARSDYERINGYDENYRGWGCEDDDLRLRLCAAGVKIASIAWWTHTYHLWHPKTPTAPTTWRAGANVEYFRRPLRLTRCLAGMRKRRLQDVHVSLVGRPPKDSLQMLPAWCRVAAASRNQSSESQPELEIAFCGPGARFSRNAECRVLIVQDSRPIPRHLTAAADIVFSSQTLDSLSLDRQFRFGDLDRVLQWQLGHYHPAPARLAAAA